jgi:acylphosphatase
MPPDCIDWTNVAGGWPVRPTDEVTLDHNTRLRAIVKGNVQGVGFRYHTVARATELGLVGSVRNRWDGSVEVLAEGTDRSVRQLLGWLYTGPRWARVEDIEVEWGKPTGEYDRFEVRF